MGSFQKLNSFMFDEQLFKVILHGIHGGIDPVFTSMG